MTKKLLVITGPTASGKTATTVSIALQLHGEIISADSMQVYSGMAIGTAQPTADEMRGVYHHMIGVMSPNVACSAALYRDYARKIVDDCFMRGTQPIICGGTGLYINAITLPMTFGEFSGDIALRNQLSSVAETPDGRRELLRQLNEIDPNTASRLHENDVRRIIRALEIHAATGKTLSEHMALNRGESSPYDAMIFALNMPREVLRKRINARVDAMFEHGLVEEARRLSMDAPTAMQAIGHKEILTALRGEYTMDEARTRIKIATAQYAKRQMTWLRRDTRVIWVDAERDMADISREIIDTFNGGVA